MENLVTCCCHIRLPIGDGIMQRLMCTLALGHQGKHYDQAFGYEWRDTSYTGLPW